MRTFTLASVLSAAILVAWIVAYMTTYNAGHAAAHDGPWFAETEVAREGWSQFQRAGCAQCHSILGQQGQSSGPDLTYVGKRWNADLLTRLIREPRSIFPNTMMPASSNLTNEEVDAIARYLETLK